MKRFHLLASAAIVAVAATLAHDAAAQQQRRAMAAPQAQAPQWYLGVGIGRGYLDGNFSTSDLPAGGASSFSAKDSDFAARAFGGLKLYPYLAIDCRYWLVGEFGARRNVTSPVAGTRDRTFEVDGLGASMLAIWPVAENLSLFGKLGIVHVRSRDRESNTFTGVSTKSSSNRVALQYGIGAQYDITRTLGRRADWDMLKRATNSAKLSLNGDSIDFRAVTGSVVVKF